MIFGNSCRRRAAANSSRQAFEPGGSPSWRTLHNQQQRQYDQPPRLGQHGREAAHGRASPVSWDGLTGQGGSTTSEPAGNHVTADKGVVRGRVVCAAPTPSLCLCRPPVVRLAAPSAAELGRSERALAAMLSVTAEAAGTVGWSEGAAAFPASDRSAHCSFTYCLWRAALLCACVQLFRSSPIEARQSCATCVRGDVVLQMWFAMRTIVLASCHLLGDLDLSRRGQASFHLLGNHSRTGKAPDRLMEQESRPVARWL